MVSTVLNTLALAASAAALTTSAAGVQNGCYYNVAGVGAFNTKFAADFTSGSSIGSDFATSSYTVASGTSPYARRFDMTNLGYSSSNTALTLTVPGGQTAGPISSSQLVTSYSDILYGSVRTVAMISNSAGTTHGFTFYSNDTQEIDFAFLTADTSLVHLTNEATNGGTASGVTFNAPSDATTKFHEYRVDWTPASSSFFIDGVNVATISTNVPSAAGFWVWNNWSNGNVWAAGPPSADSVLQIQSITGYVNRTSVASNIASGAQVCAVSSSTSSVKATSTAAAAFVLPSLFSTVAAAVVPTVATSSAAVVPTVATSSAAVVVPTVATVSTAAAVKATSTAITSSSSSSVKSTSTSSAVAAGATAGATCGSLFGGITTACATGLTCAMSGLSYVCTAENVATSKNILH